MRQLSCIASVGLLALLLKSCGGEDSPPQPSASATSPSPVASSPSPAAPSPQVFASSTPPLVAQQPASLPAVPGLVQSTNPDVREPQVQVGRKDPFANIPLQPVVKVSPNANEEQGAGTAPRPVPTLPAIPLPPSVSIGTGGSVSGKIAPNKLPPAPGKLPNTPSTPRQPTTIAARPKPATGPATPRPAAPRPGSIPNLSPTPTVAFIPSLPKLPEPSLAQSVEVSGVVQIGGVPQAIVKAPNEPNSRYVRAGQRLANGQVLVKRIEMNEGSNPVVVLEQFGIEIAKAVGEKAGPTSPQIPGRPTAALPLATQTSSIFSPQA